MLFLRTACCLIAVLCSLNSTLAGTLVQFRTALGNIEVELYDNDKPVTVHNFLQYLQSGRYQNEFAHRLVPGFVIQGGGFTITNYGTTNWTQIAIPTYPPITNEFGVGQRYSNIYGTIAMAKLGGDTNSATSQWYFNLANNTGLDAPDTNNLFVVFGHVIAGTNVLNLFNTFPYWTFPWPVLPAGTTNVLLYQLYGPPFDTLPLLYGTINSTIDTNFVFMDISLLQVSIQPATGGGRQISWNSAAGLTNIVEFTTNLPPVWNTLATTNGTGARMAVVDAAADPKRFYRVRVTY